MKTLSDPVELASPELAPKNALRSPLLMEPDWWPANVLFEPVVLPAPQLWPMKTIFALQGVESETPAPAEVIVES